MSASLFDIYWDDKDCEREYKFYVYATDQTESYLDEIYKSDDRQRVIATMYARNPTRTNCPLSMMYFWK